jgi:hypothetical protein
MAGRDPADFLDEVVDLRTFLAFVGALIHDRVADVAKQRLQSVDPFGRGPNGWETDSIEDFLDTALRWVQDTDMGQTQGLPEGPSWRAFAVFLYRGKIYE